ncbi:MAG TPA: transposase [Chloroflexota bacterium]|nr:transposase [Chloroflexota bacterium]
MQRTVCLRLKATPEQRASLLRTMEQSSACFNAVAAYGWEHKQRNSVELHKATYYRLRGEYPALPSQLVVSARMRAAEAIASALTLRKRGRAVSRPSGTMIPIRYDEHSYRMVDGAASLASVSGRHIVAFAVNPHAAKLLSQAVSFDSADLIFRKAKLWLHAIVTLPDVPFADSGKVVGIDLGLNRPAVTSNNMFHGSRHWRAIEQRTFRLRRQLQAKGTVQAKRRLRRLSGKTARFRRDCDHVLSKRIVQSVRPGTTLVLENLTDIRTRVRQRGSSQRRRLHAWSFAQLRSFVTYKANSAGSRVVAIDPRHTSQTCSRCRVRDKRSRVSQAIFRCRSCGFELNADLNAARNIAVKHVQNGRPVLGGAPVNCPIVGEPVEVQHGATDKLPALAGSR